MTKTVYLNGDYLPHDQARVSVMDRGFLFGDGVYEVIPVYCREPLRLDEHMTRLQNSLDGIKLANPYSTAQWCETIRGVIEQNDSDHQSVYLQVTRGAPEKRDHAFPAQSTPTVFIMSNPMADLPDEASVMKASATTLDDIRWQLCHVKSVALLGNVLLKQEALDRGYDEAILVRDGLATECSASNLFMVKDGVLVTPPKSNLLLPGITRDLVVDLAKEHEVPFEERDIRADELSDADELWFTSSTKAIVPMVSLNDAPVGTGAPGALWQHMMAYYRAHIDQYKRGEKA